MRFATRGQVGMAGQIVAMGGAIAVAVAALARWHDQKRLAAALIAELQGVALPQGGTLLGAYLLSLVPAALFVIAMVEARHLFWLLGAGRVFTPATPKSLKRLSLWAAASALAAIVMRTAQGLVLSADAAPGQRQLVIGIGANEIALLVVGLLLFAFALVMQDAIAIDQDNRGIV